MGKNKMKDIEYEHVNNFRELVKRYEGFGDNIAFKYKENKEIKEVTYRKCVEDIKKVAEVVLDSDIKRVAVIGNNRYEWCITYLGVTTAGKVIVPLDKALTNTEIEKLLQRSKADVIVYDENIKKQLMKLLNKDAILNIKFVWIILKLKEF